MQFELSRFGVFVAYIKARSSLIEWIKKTQCKDLKLKKLIEEVRNAKNFDFTLDQEGALRCGNCLCVPNLSELKRIILEKAHNSKYTIHLGSAKMYQDMRKLYWWESMKKDIGDFVSRCLIW